MKKCENCSLFNDDNAANCRGCNAQMVLKSTSVNSGVINLNNNYITLIISLAGVFFPFGNMGGLYFYPLQYTFGWVTLAATILAGFLIYKKNHTLLFYSAIFLACCAVFRYVFAIYFTDKLFFGAPLWANWALLPAPLIFVVSTYFEAKLAKRINN
jgi:hypothetical protein